MKIALAQINTIVGDLAGNTKRMATLIDEARLRKAQLVVFPELAICGYPPEDLLLKPHFIDANIRAVDALAKKTKGLSVLVGFVDSDGAGKAYNAAALIVDGKVKKVYRKQQLPNYGVFDEKRYFTSGTDDGIAIAADIKIGISICEDIWIDGPIWTKQAPKADVLINISCSPYEVGKLKAREALLSRRAKQIKKPIVYVNLVGGQDELVFDGASMVVGPDGKVLARAKQFEEELLIVDLEGDALSIAPMLEEDAEIYQALVLGTRDYVYKNGFNKVALGLSGGIDSALVACIAVDALGPDNVMGFSMPTKFNSKGTKSDARLLAENLGIAFKEIPIQRIYEGYLKLLNPLFEDAPANSAEENVQARIRGNILMALSNKFGWLVLTTGNKSEMAVGYCTLYGDMSGGFAVIKDIFKTRVYSLMRWRNSQGRKAVVPKTILLRAPTAELKPNQTDEASLGSYEDLDRVLEAYVQRHQSLENIVAQGLDKSYVQKTLKLVDINEYKRRQAPPGIKISLRAFGKDWRLPITNKYRE